MRLAVGTSLVIITATSLMALLAHLAAGRTLDIGVTLSMTGACIAGALAGVGLAGRVAQRTLGKGFAALVVGIAAYLLISAALLGGPPRHVLTRPRRASARIAQGHGQLIRAFNGQIDSNPKYKPVIEPTRPMSVSLVSDGLGGDEEGLGDRRRSRTRGLVLQEPATRIGCVTRVAWRTGK